MADQICVRSCQTKSSPQILFVRLGKEPTKDSIQKKIFKCVKSVLEDSVNDKGKRNNEKSCEVCPGIRSDEVCEVALGPEFIGIVLNNGRVCRLKCSSNTLDSSKKPKKTQSSKSEDIFQVQSDEAYARRVQDQLNTVEVNSTSLSSTLDPLLTPSPDILMPETAESLLPEMNFFSSDSDQTSSVPFSSIEDNPEAINNDRDAGLDSVSTPRGLVTERTSLPVVSRNPLAQLGQNRAERPLQKETTSKNITADVVSNADSPNQSTKQDETRKRSFNSSSDSKVKAGSSATETRTSTSVSSLISHDKSQTSQSSLAIQESRNNSQTRSDITFFPRRSIASPTFIQRTIFPADPFYYRPPRGMLNAPMILPRPGTLYSFDSRRLRDTFGSRSSIRYQPQGRTVHHFGPPSRSLGNHSDSTRRGRAQPGDSGRKGGVEDENAKFFYPKLGELEWLETETGEDVFFEHIAALHSEFLLVEKNTGTLYHWPYASENAREDQLTAENSMNVDVDIEGELGSVSRSKPHPLLEELGLMDESVNILAACSIRCSLVTRSGKICTFYDDVIREPEESQTQAPALIQELSHQAEMFPELRGEVVTSIDCSEFFSSIMTQSGKVFWWGLLPSEERQGFKQKLHKVNRETCHISVGDKVQLRRHLPGFPGALVYRSCDTTGPQIARLLSHETPEDGGSMIITKIKVELLNRPQTACENASGRVSPLVTIPKVDSPLSAVRVGSQQSDSLRRRNLLESGTVSAASTPHFNRSNMPARVATNTDIWDVSSVVFLESESKVLGTVAAIDGPHVIVRVASVSNQNETSLRVFKVSELETVMAESGNDVEGTSLHTQVTSSLIYRGCIQRQPKCIVDAARPSLPVTVKSEVLTGLKPVAMATTHAGVNLLVQRNADGKSFYLGSVTDTDNDNSKVFTSVSNEVGVNAESDGSVTVEAESVRSDHAALSSSPWKLISDEVTGQKRKWSAGDDNSSQSDSSEINSSWRNQSLKSCRVSCGRQSCPSLHSLPVTNLVLLCDKNGCLYARPFNTKLSNPSMNELVPLKCLAIGQRVGHMISSENSEQKVLVLFVAFKQLSLIPAIQSGVVSRVQDVVDLLESRLLATGVGGKKGRGEVKGVKRMAIVSPGGSGASPQSIPKAVSPSSSPPELSSELEAVLNEHISCNQNVLHVCCTNPSFLVNIEHAEVNSVLGDYRANTASKPAGDGIETEVLVLDLLLNHKLFGRHFIPMLKELDARGCTPFMTAIQCHNLKAAVFILDFVEKNKEAFCSLQEMIFTPSAAGITPLHALAICTCDNLNPAGLGSSLTVSNLPSSYTPRILLKLFQSRYPSAYRATIPVITGGEKFKRVKSPRQQFLESANQKEKEKEAKTPKLGAPDAGKASLLTPSPTVAPSPVEPRAAQRRRRFHDADNRIPVIGSRRESQEGMVTFADPKELRQALIEMDKHVVSSEMTVPEGGLASLVQYVLHVKLTEAHGEDEKTEMEVKMQGMVYGVSSAGGTTKISRKTQTSDATQEEETGEEDELVCKLFSRLLSYTELATSVNKEKETVLAFLINNSRWIKPTAHQQLRLAKHTNRILGSSTKPEEKGDERKHEGVTAEIKIMTSSGSSAIESNLLAQLDDISNSFKSLVDTLTALERGNLQPGQMPDRTESEGIGDRNDGPKMPVPGSEDLISFTSEINGSRSQNKDVSGLPVLIQLAKSWPCIVATILGEWPFGSPDGNTGGSDTRMGEEPAQITSLPSPSDACSVDALVQSLLGHADESVLLSFVETIVEAMNRHAADLSLETVLNSQTPSAPLSRANVAFSVGLRFLRSVVRQMAIHLSQSSLSYIDLRTRVGGSNGVSSLRSGQSDNMEFKRKTRKILASFSWLAVHELVQSAEATILPVREGVAKPQIRSTGSSVTNSLPIPRFPGTRLRAPPGIRVSGPLESGSHAQGAKLRTATKITSDKATVPLPRCRGIRLANIDEAAVTPAKQRPPPVSEYRRSASHRRSTSHRGPMMDSDTDSDDDDDDGIIRGSDYDNDMDIDDPEDQSVVMATGITYEHPYAWALDGRLSAENSNSVGIQHINLGAYAAAVSSPPSVHTGNCYLARMFARLVKEAVDLMTSLSAKGSPEEPVLPVLSVTSVEGDSIRDLVTSVLDQSWIWVARLLDVVEGQLQMGKQFDTKRYLASLQRAEEPDVTFSRQAPTVPGASPEEYLMFLLRSHNREHNDSLPVIDMLCYEHAVYVLDSLIYSMSHWPRPQADGSFSRSLSTQSTGQAEELSTSSSFGHERDISEAAGPSVVKTRKRVDKEREQVTRFFGKDVLGEEFDQFLTKLSETLQRKSQLFIPRASWEIFTLGRQQSVDITSQSGLNDDNRLPVTQAAAARQTYPHPLVTSWTPDVAIDRWKISVDLFSRLFLSDGPGAERDSFLAARAGVAGRLARFRRTISYLRESIASESQQSGFGLGGLSLAARVGTTLSLSVKRTRLVEDTLRILGDMTSFHYSNFRAKFEGEEGSGPGVNRGFFASVANALKTEEKFPPHTTSLLHEPGKLPEQSGFYSPKPFSYPDATREDSVTKNQRHKMFTSIGRFIGLSLWFNNTVPINFSRHVVKHLLEQEVMWEDLAYFNADLFEGLGRMMLDAAHPSMTSERFQSTYCCHFETSVGGSTEELIPGGSQIPVTPENIYKYVKLYAHKVMIGSIESELRAMRHGLHDIIPGEILQNLKAEDFQLLLSGGTTDIDINRLKSVITFTNSNGCSADILERFKRWFWSIVQKMMPLHRQQLLYFCTGSAMLPAFPDRRDGDQEDLVITIDVISGNTKALPMATTCGQRMSIPLYPSRKILKRKLLQAIQCQSYGLG